VILYPTRPTLHVALAGAAMVASGVLFHRHAPAAFGGAVLLALAVARGLSLLAATRLRQAGFEMAWTESRRVANVVVGEVAVLDVELKNRSKDPARAAVLRAMASSFLDVEVIPRDCDLPPGSVVHVEMRVTATRTGRWGLHGLALELRGMPLGGEGLFETPLVFSSPFGVDAAPRALSAMLRSPRGGRSGRVTDSGRSARARGEGDELRELRDHVVGDPWKRIAWRASARKGRLIVREMERQERDIVWLVMDASVDGWAGPPGKAPLDRAVESVAAAATKHLARGDRVGLVLFASRPRAWIKLGQGRPQAALIASALSGASSTIDVDRSALEENDVAQRVAEHMRPLVRDERTLLRALDKDRLAKLAETVRLRAPFAARLPYAPSPRERTLRHYLACFGIESPPRAEGERARSESELGRMLMKLVDEKPRPTIVTVWAPAPVTTGLVAHAVRTLRARRTEIRWNLPEVLPSIGAGSAESPVAESVEAAVRLRVTAEHAREIAALRALGVTHRSVVIRRPEPGATATEGESLQARSEP